MSWPLGEWIRVDTTWRPDGISTVTVTRRDGSSQSWTAGPSRGGVFRKPSIRRRAKHSRATQ